MSDRLARWVFWVGTLFSLVLFLALTVDTHARFAALTHADTARRPGRGRQAGVRDAQLQRLPHHPRLRRLLRARPDPRLRPGSAQTAITRRLEHPEAAFADSYRKMPQQRLAAAEIADIAAYLAGWTGSRTTTGRRRTRPRAGSARPSGCWPARSLSPGAALVKQESCLACHALGDARRAGRPAARVDRREARRRLDRRVPRGSGRSSHPGTRCLPTATSRRRSAG